MYQRTSKLILLCMLVFAGCKSREAKRNELIHAKLVDAIKADLNKENFERLDSVRVLVVDSVSEKVRLSMLFEDVDDARTSAEELRDLYAESYTSDSSMVAFYKKYNMDATRSVGYMEEDMKKINTQKDRIKKIQFKRDSLTAEKAKVDTNAHWGYRVVAMVSGGTKKRTYFTDTATIYMDRLYNIDEMRIDGLYDY